MLSEFEFFFEETDEKHWVVVACPAWGDRITLPGLFISRAAAQAAIARTKPKWNREFQVLPTSNVRH